MDGIKTLTPSRGCFGMDLCMWNVIIQRKLKARSFIRLFFVKCSYLFMLWINVFCSGLFKDFT